MFLATNSFSEIIVCTSFVSNLSLEMNSIWVEIQIIEMDAATSSSQLRRGSSHLNENVGYTLKSTHSRKTKSQHPAGSNTFQFLRHLASSLRGNTNAGIVIISFLQQSYNAVFEVSLLRFRLFTGKTSIIHTLFPVIYSLEKGRCYQSHYLSPYILLAK